jgi:hypothetical protein
MIISISGRIGSGKDTVADIIKQVTPYYNWEVKKFAGKLKDIAELLTGVPKTCFESQEFKDRQMGPEWGMTYRDLLQKLGTEAMRNGLHENVWVNALFSDYVASTVAAGTSEFDITEEDQLPNWIITDCRFPNELSAVQSHNGITIKVERDLILRKGYDIPKAVDLHPSETSLDGYTSWDYVITNNGTLEDLHRQVIEILEQKGLVKFHAL